MRQDKTKLTRSLILQDIQAMYHAKRSIMVGSLFLAAVTLVFGFYSLVNPIAGQSARGVYSFLLTAFFLLGPLEMWLWPRRLQKKVTIGSYRVVTDHLLSIDEGRLYGRFNRRPPSLVFRDYGRFLMDWNAQSHQVHSAFSKRTVQETAQVGEAFYLVLVGNRIIGAYSHRFFELESQDQ